MRSDVIVAGGGVAGSVVASALSGFGYKVLVIEPGLQHARRLSGELIHPTGVSNLNALGLLSCLEQAGSSPVLGFAVLPGPYLLPYKDVPGLTTHGLAIDHATLAEKLLCAVSKLDGVTVWRGARISAVDLTDAGRPTITVKSDAGEDKLEAQMLVAADGRNSHVRGMAGIRHNQVQLSSMVGYTLRRRVLPHSGFGHVFIGGSSPVLAYELATGETRIMFDIAKQEDWQLCLDALPTPVRKDFEAVKDSETPLRAANYSIIPERVTKGRMVCVGDAGGCCHPLTATGLSACTRDALLLRQALRETSAEIPKALERYARLRQGPQSTRLVSAKALYDVLRGQSQEMRLLRQGLFQYWQTPRGRRKTVALLSAHEVRRSVLVREYLQVCKFALPGLLHSNAPRGHTVVGLSRALLRFVGEAYLGCK